MTPAELFAFFRSQADDLRAPYLWSDEEIWQYMDDAQFMFARLTDGIADATTPEVCSVSVVTGESFSLVHHSILTFRHAARASDFRPITIVNYEDIVSHRFDDDYGMPRTFKLDDKPGPVDFMVIGMERDKVRWVHVPVVDDTVKLIVYRMPIKHITGVDPAPDPPEAFEIGEEHHWHLLKWMKHLAYSKEDAETFDKSKATEHESAFQTYCTKVMFEQGRYKHKHRLVAYGGL